MGKKSSIIYNFFMNAVLAMSSFIFPLITFPYVSRILSPVGLGKVSFATSLISYFVMFSQLGIPTYGIRKCAQVRDDKDELNKTVQELFCINLITSCIAYIIFFTILCTVPRLENDKILYCTISTTILFNLFGMEWLYKALEQYSYITVRSLFFKIVALVLMFGLVHSSDDYIIYGAITIFASSASNILNFINLRKHISLRKINNLQCEKHIKSILIFFAMAVATTIYTNLDSVMLGFISGDESVGYYTAAVKIKTVLVSLIASLGTVLLPRASYYVEKGDFNTYERMTDKALNFVILASIPITIYGITYAEECIIFLSGSEYIKSICSMRIIMPTVILITVTSITGTQMLVPMNKEKVVLSSEIVGAVVDMFLNAILIPRYESAGAAIGTLVAELCVFIYQIYFLKNRFWKSVKQVKFLYIFICILVSLMASLAPKYVFKNVFIILVFSAFLFFGSYIVLLYLLKESLIEEGVLLVLKKLKK